MNAPLREARTSVDLTAGDVAATLAELQASSGGVFLPPSRELWRPSHDEQMAALEILLAYALPRELRSALREREVELSGTAGSAAPSTSIEGKRQ